LKIVHKIDQLQLTKWVNLEVGEVEIHKVTVERLYKRQQRAEITTTPSLNPLSHSITHHLYVLAVT